MYCFFRTNEILAKVEPIKVEPAKTESTQPVKKAVNPLTEHFYKKYVTAIQWNDYDVAKDALYDLIVENPQNDSLIFSLAYYYYQNEKYAPAVLVSQQLLTRNPKISLHWRFLVRL